jgi:hypothetical protein
MRSQNSLEATTSTQRTIKKKYPVLDAYQDQLRELEQQNKARLLRTRVEMDAKKTIRQPTALDNYMQQMKLLDQSTEEKYDPQQPREENQQQYAPSPVIAEPISHS